MSFSDGENIGVYRIVEQLGSGGMATVFKAYHAALDRYVAIKVLHPAFRGDASFSSRFQREARVVAKLDHPNIVPVYDFSEHEGSPYLVMRFIEGETLKARLNRGQLALPDILNVIRPMGDALSYAHEQGVLHRDIKPSNVLLRRDNRVFLTDFGLARMMEAGESSLTRDALVGTPQYISPEQAMGKSHLDARTDIYSFGVVLYELFTGQVPFHADTPYAIIHDHIYTPLPLPRSINPNLPPALEQVLLKALAKNPDDRYSTAAELVEATEEAVASAATFSAPGPTAVSPAAIEQEATSAAPTVVPATPVPEKPRAPTPAKRPEQAAPARGVKKSGRGVQRRWLLALGIVGVLAVVAATVLFIFTEGQDEGSEPNIVESPAVEQPAVDEPKPDQVDPNQEIRELMEHANELVRRGDIDGAMEAFERAMQLEPHAPPVYVEAARVLLQHDHADPAIAILHRGVEANPDDVDLHLFLAQTAMALERWDEAVPEFEWLIEHVPEMPEPHAYLSVHLVLNVGDLDGAEHHAAEALRINPNSAAGHFALGVLHWQNRDFRRARAEFERARRSDDVTPYLRERIQHFLERMEEPEPEP
jgi:serine/threonine-protein kinase